MNPAERSTGSVMRKYYLLPLAVLALALIGFGLFMIWPTGSTSASIVQNSFQTITGSQPSSLGAAYATQNDEGGTEIYLPIQVGAEQSTHQNQQNSVSSELLDEVQQVVRAANLSCTPAGDVPCEDGMPFTVLSSNNPPVVTISSPVDGATFVEGDSVTFTGTANDTEDGDLTSSIDWVSDIDGDLGAGGGSFSTTGLSVGTHLVTASVSDINGVNGSDSIVLTITSEVSASDRSVVYVSTSGSGVVGGYPYADEDIMVYERSTEIWAYYFDGSDVGLAGADIDAFTVMDDDSILFSLNSEYTISGLGLVDDSDIVRFIPTSVGRTTSGGFEWYFDGSDVGVDTDAEDIDALSILPDGSIVFSTIGHLDVAGTRIGWDEDLFQFTPSTGHTGENTVGTLSLYFEGSDVGLGYVAKYDIWGTWIDPNNGDVLITTQGDFTVGGVSGQTEDIFSCTPSSLGSTTACSSVELEWIGSTTDLNGEVIDGIAIGEDDTVQAANQFGTSGLDQGGNNSNSGYANEPDNFEAVDSIWIDDDNTSISFESKFESDSSSQTTNPIPIGVDSGGQMSKPNFEPALDPDTIDPDTSIEFEENLIYLPLTQ